MTAHLKIGENSPIKLDGYDSDRKRTPRGKKALQWRGRTRYRNQDGTTSDVTRWAPTKEAAEQAVLDAIADKAAAAITGAKLTPGMPFVEAGRYWLTQMERQDGGLSVRTQREYRGAFERHIDVAGSPFRGLTLAQTNEVGQLLPLLQHIADAKGTQTAKLVRVVLGHILGMAVRYRVLPYSATRMSGGVRAKSERPSERDHSRAMTRAERDMVIATADAKVKAATNPRSVAKWQTVADCVAFMAGTGCRIQEARLLQWADVDLKEGTVRVRGTKSASADRQVNLPEWLSQRLAKRQATAKADAKSAAKSVAKGAALATSFGPYVFGYVPHEEVGTDGLRRIPGTNRPIDQSNLATSVRTVLDEAGLPWAIPHSFRRTVASMLHQQGAALVRIADQLGHSDPSMTAKVYLGRDFRGDKADLAALL